MILRLAPLITLCKVLFKLLKPLFCWLQLLTSGREREPIAAAIKTLKSIDLKLIMSQGRNNIFIMSFMFPSEK